MKSSNTTTMEERDSNYFPGCRKDANCNCEICLASINATLDLMPLSIQKSSLTKLSSSSRPNLEKTPVSFDSSFVSTPTSSYCPIVESPAAALRSSARLSFDAKKEDEKVECGHRRDFKGVMGTALRLVLCLSLIFAVESGFSWGVSCVFRPVFSADAVKGVAQRSWVAKDLNVRLRFLQNELKGFVAGNKISNCSFVDSVWEINQDGQLLHSRCVLYKSAVEEVSIWGWPLQTAGLLKTGFASRSFTVLSGRVTEWSNGKIGYLTRKAKTSWVQRKWGASVVQLDPSTWILEYRQSSILDNSRLLSAIAELSKYKISQVMKRMNGASWFLSAFEDHYRQFTARDHVKLPT
ncbi:hypothetical protein Tsubulata_035666 [Turnera subulata]|uniref:Uncharacterized protein n=1 Tax=Turnera subulata TaxID=218843 RepID=A0A9Q0EZ88_9ROSI|nr:hypothetical protein Tsubulata_035666 [Turnera subulata]